MRRVSEKRRQRARLRHGSTFAVVARKPRSSATRRKGLPSRNRKRQASAFARAFHSKARVAFVKALPCTLDSGACAGPMHNHHTRSRGAGGDFTTIVPLCQLHHDVVHRFGQRSAFAAHRVDPKEAATRVEAMWSAWQSEGKGRRTLEQRRAPNASNLEDLAK